MRSTPREQGLPFSTGTPLLSRSPMPQHSPTATPARLVALDQLRTLTIGYVLCYHVALICANGGTSPGVSDAARWFLLPAVLATGLWRMPLMFLIAGASTELFLRRRSWREFVALRVQRLLVPAAFALAVVVPVWRYAEVASRETPVAFAAHAWDYLAGANGPDWYHVWFIVYLVAITAAALVARPLAARVLRSVAGRYARSSAAAAIGERDLVPITIVVAGALLSIAVQAVPTRIAMSLVLLGVDARRLAAFGVCFAAGIAFARVDRALALVEARRSTLAVLAIGFGLAAGTLDAALMSRVELLPAVTMGGRAIGLDECALRLVGGAGAWFGALTALGYGQRYFRTSSTAFEYLRDASFAVYLLHQAVLAWILRGLAGWEARVETEYVVLVLLTVVATLACYEFAVRRTRLGRAVFGLPARVADQPGLVEGVRVLAYATVEVLDRVARRRTARGAAPMRRLTAWRNAASER